MSSSKSTGNSFGDDASDIGSDVEAASQLDADGEHKQKQCHDDQHKLEVAQKEDKWVFWLRVLTTLALLSVAVAVCLGVYFQGRKSEKESFEQDFSALGEKLVRSFTETVRQRVGIITSFGQEITSQANNAWPFVTPPNFNARAETTAMLAQFMWLRLIPQVTRSNLDLYVNYTQANQGWRTEGLARQNGIPPEDVNAQDIFPTIINVHNPNGPTPAVEIDEEGPYYPFWCAYPVSNKTLTNLDIHGDVVEHKAPMDYTMETGHPVFENSVDYLGGQEKDLRYDGITQIPFIKYLDDPHTAAFFPGKFNVIYDWNGPNIFQ